MEGMERCTFLPMTPRQAIDGVADIFGIVGRCLQETSRLRLRAEIWRSSVDDATMPHHNWQGNTMLDALHVFNNYPHRF